MFIIDTIEALGHFNCVRCNKNLSIPIHSSGSEWLFYEKTPESYDDENEFLFIDKERLEIDPHEVIRQELLLNVPVNPHCETDCSEFKDDPIDLKPLAGLKEMWENRED